MLACDLSDRIMNIELPGHIPDHLVYHHSCLVNSLGNLCMAA